MTFQKTAGTKSMRSQRDPQGLRLGPSDGQLRGLSVFKSRKCKEVPFFVSVEVWGSKEGPACMP